MEADERLERARIRRQDPIFAEGHPCPGPGRECRRARTKAELALALEQRPGIQGATPWGCVPGWKSIEHMIDQVDVAFVDGTFFDAGELPGRDPSEMPHPTIRTSLERFSTFAHRERIRFIHLNHSNALLSPTPPALPGAFRVAVEGEAFPL